MTAALAFEPALGRVRRARFVPRSGISLEVACAVANGVRDALGGILGDGAAITIGEPVAVDAAAWRSLAAGTLAFVVPGCVTDLAFVLSPRDARALIAVAFHEEPAAHDASWSALEAGALERIVARCAPACEALGGERRGPVATVDPAHLEPCVEAFDLRVAAPVGLTIAVGIARPLPLRPPSRTLAAATLGAVPLEVRVVLGRGALDAAAFVRLRTGDVVPLQTKVAGEGELNVAGHRIALGTCGVADGHAAFDVQSTKMRGDAP